MKISELMTKFIQRVYKTHPVMDFITNFLLHLLLILLLLFLIRVLLHWNLDISGAEKDFGIITSFFGYGDGTPPPTEPNPELEDFLPIKPLADPASTAPR